MCLNIELDAFKMYDAISRAMLRKESIGYDPSKGKVIHKDKISGYDSL